MMERNVDRAVANRVELAIRQLDSLSILPCVAAQFLAELRQAQFSPSTLSETIESDPALTARIFRACHQQGLSFIAETPSVRRALDKLPAHIVRDALFSVKVLHSFNNGLDSSRASTRKELMRHSLAVACCARDIAEIVSLKIDSHLAYSAGLLHDIGKFALEEVMPKSFARIIEEAASQNCSTCVIEQEHLGLEHTVLGKRLAQKWHLAEQITLAIWLHHSDTVALSEQLGETRISLVVQLADCVARQCGIGHSGSYDSPGSAEQVSQALAITPEQLEGIRRNLPGAVEQKAKTLGLDLPNAESTYCLTVQAAAAQFASDNSRLSLENRQLQTTSSHFDFIRDFLLSIDSNAGAIDIAESFAVRWQKFYQTGRVCLYLASSAGSQILEAVVVETLARAKTVYLDAPADSLLIPRVLANKFAILDVGGYADWLFEQLDVDFDLSQTKLIPLLCNGRVIGAIVFELRYPADAELFQENFKVAASIAGSVLDMTSTSCGRQRFAEEFANLLTRGKGAPQQLARIDSSTGALAEMAAGAAHELNNPLSVISGRAQLLAGAETDPEKKRILTQIQQSAQDLSGIIDDLMTFARPPSPRPTQTSIKQMLDEALQLTSRKTKAEHVNAQIEVADGLKNVFVDSAQVVSAIANVICNSLESYTGEMGPIKITADADRSGGFVELKISDLGCGMDLETMKRAAQPFFSARPAGRKRGMGLAHAQRLIESNNGGLRITSQPGRGTTVIILLPCK